MPLMQMKKSSFFCIGNLAHCAQTTDIRMLCRYADGNEKEFRGTDMLCDGEKAANALFRDGDTLWISVRETRSSDQREITGIVLEIKAYDGDTERLCLTYGTAELDMNSRSYRFVPENSALRFSRIELIPSGTSVEIILGEKDETAGDAAADVHNDISVQRSADDLYGDIEADMNILKYYTGDKSVGARDMLESARKMLSGGDTDGACDTVTKAELLIAECIDAATGIIRGYSRR